MLFSSNSRALIDTLLGVKCHASPIWKKLSWSLHKELTDGRFADRKSHIAIIGDGCVLWRRGAVMGSVADLGSDVQFGHPSFP